MTVIELNKKYKIVYNDMGYKPVIKIGTVVSKEDTLFKLDNGDEILNTIQIVRAHEVKQ